MSEKVGPDKEAFSRAHFTLRHTLYKNCGFFTGCGSRAEGDDSSLVRVSWLERTLVPSDRSVGRVERAKVGESLQRTSRGADRRLAKPPGASDSRKHRVTVIS